MCRRLTFNAADLVVFGVCQPAQKDQRPMLITHGDIELEILPERGGGVARFTAFGFDIFRPAVVGDPSPLALSNFALVPFSGRIASGAFMAGGRQVRLPVTAAVDPDHAIHGHGWTAAWQVAAHDRASIVMRYDHPGGDWPWRYRSEQQLTLTDSGYRHGISVQNLGDSAMPAGLGLHPYFPRPDAVIETVFDDRWALDDNRLPSVLETAGADYDWFGGTLTDHGFGRKAGGAISIAWPRYRVAIIPAADLPHTVIYIPPGENFFCIEPVSHVANAVNMTGAQPAMRWLAPGETWQTSAEFAVTIRN
jgi:aldose 1-epimerase